MSLLPNMGDFSLPKVSKERASSKTYRLDLEGLRIAGMIDNQEAIKQAIHKVLLTEREAYEIYGTSGYGIFLEDLIGQNRFIVEAELKRRIKEALLADDRVTELHSFSFEGGLDWLHTRFIAETIAGTIPVERGFSL